MTVGALRFLDPGDRTTRRTWDEITRSSPGATVFHTTAWMDVVQQGLGLKPRFAYLARASGDMCALIPLFQAEGMLRPVRWLNLPQSCAADPLAARADDKRVLLEQLTEAADRNGVAGFVLRTSHDPRPALPTGWKRNRDRSLVRHVIPLGGSKDIGALPGLQRRQRERFRSSKRTLQASGYRSQLATIDEANAFARAVHHILLRRHGHLGMPHSFFTALLRNLPGIARLASISDPHGRILAFVVTLWDLGRCDFLYGSGSPSKSGEDAYRVCLESEIEAAIAAGLEVFDMHETNPDNHGLIISKQRWGARQADGSYLILAREGADCALHVDGKGFRPARRLLRHAPVGLSMALSGAVHRALQ